MKKLAVRCTTMSSCLDQFLAWSPLPCLHLNMDIEVPTLLLPGVMRSVLGLVGLVLSSP